MRPRAIVVHSDASVGRMLSDGLSVFSPGYEVVTTVDLASAGEWVASRPPNLVVVEFNGYDWNTIRDWAQRHGVEARRILVVGLDGHPPGGQPTWGILPKDFELSSVLSFVKQLGWSDTDGGSISTYPEETREQENV